MQEGIKVMVITTYIDQSNLRVLGSRLSNALRRKIKLKTGEEEIMNLSFSILIRRQWGKILDPPSF